MAYFYNAPNNSISEDATNQIRPSEFRDATNKSEYRLIWLSASQFLPFRFFVPLRFPLVPRACGKSHFRRGGAFRAKFVSLVRALAF